MFYILFIIYLALTSLGLLFIKLGGQQTHISVANSLLSMQMDIKFVVGLVFYVLSFFLYTIILQKRDLSYIYPVSAGIVNVLSVLMGVIILKEKLTTPGVIGIIAIVIGVVLLNVRGSV